MPKITNPVVIADITNSLRQGNSARQAALDGGLTEKSAHNATKRKVVLSCMAEVRTELTDDYIVEQLQAILKLKMSVERKLFEFIDRYKRITPANLRNVTLAINKTKDNITEISKLLRLYNGDSTENLNLSDEETTSRRNRLIDMARGIN